MTRYLKPQTGLTIIELMVGIALGVVVLGGVLSVFLPTVQTWRANSALSAIQDVEQIAHSELGRNLRQSGLLVCGENDKLTNSVPNTPSSSIAKWAFDFTQPFKAFGATDSSSIAGSIEASGEINELRLGQDGNKLNNNSASQAVGDVFYALVPGGESMRIVNNDNKTSGNQFMVVSGVTDTGATNIKTGELFLVHDCEFPIIVRAEQDSTATIHYTNTAHIGQNFPPKTMVSRFTPTLYYLSELNTVPTLYKRTISNSLSGSSLSHIDTPVLSGVENIRVEYGVDLPAANNATPTEPAIVTNYYTTEQMNSISLSGSPTPDIYDYALVARLTLMIQTDQVNTNSFQQHLEFPSLSTGAIYDCYSSSTEATACPAFLANTRDRAHKVVHYSFNLSTKHIIAL